MAESGVSKRSRLAMTTIPHCAHRRQSRFDGMVFCDSDHVGIPGAIPESFCAADCWVVNRPNEKSRGVGDTIHKALHVTGIDNVVSAVSSVIGSGCGGCGDRKELLNRILPYTPAGDRVDETRVVCDSVSRSDAVPFAGPVRRNLMMYIYPLRQFGVWRWNVAQIRQRLPLFNGRKIITIATDHATDSAEDVQAAFGADSERIDSWIIDRNDPARWEMLGLPRMLSYCHSCDPHDITFYCHAKGVQGPAHVDDPGFSDQPRAKWARVMYESCLDYMPLVELALERHTFAGSFKRRMTHGERPYRSSWHFAGTFYWFRNASLFSIPHWHVFDQQWYGAETWPGQLVGWYQAAGLFGSHAPIQYLAESWRDVIDPAWAAWKEANREHHRPCTIRS